MKSSTSAMYKKGKLYEETSSFRNSEYSSRDKGKTDLASSYKKRNMDLDEGSWIGTPQPTITQERTSPGQGSPPPAQPFDILQAAFLPQGSPKKQVKQSPSSKPPTQLIQDILKGLIKNNVTKVNPYYSQESEQKLSQILTNRTKLEAYISELETEMAQIDPEVAKHYQILIILLKQLGKSDIEVKHSSRGLELDFNRRQMLEQENQIERLEKKVQEKDEHIKEIIQEYESVIRNFNDVLGKLLEERDGAPAGKLGRLEESVRFTAGFK